MRKLLVFAAALAFAGTAGCTVHQTDAPTPAGPSTQAISLTVTATPDTLPQDGVSTSRIVVKAFNAGGQPLANLQVRLDMQFGGKTQDFGTLSARNVLTGSDGTAAVTYTAPAGPGTGGFGSAVTVIAYPVSSDATFALVSPVFFQALIRLTPPGGLVPPAVGTPTASFTVTPAAPTVGATVLFNGNASTSAATWEWDYGDGSPHDFGAVVTHVFTAPRPYAVTLTVTNGVGGTASTVTIVTVAVPDAVNPTASFVPSTTVAAVNDTISFDASSSSASTGVTIVLYTWVWGDGTTTALTSPTTTHSYAAVGPKTVTLTVTDSRGRTSAATAKTITIQ